jgi:hypothetical protein
MYLGEKRDTSACVTGNEGAVAAHEPPALAAFQDGDASQQLSGFGVGQREEREFLSSV